MSESKPDLSALRIDRSEPPPGTGGGPHPREWKQTSLAP